MRNPFGGADSDKVYAITVEAVCKFVEELSVRGDELRTMGESPKKETRPIPKPPKPKPVRELDTKAALDLLRSQVGRGCELNLTTFGFYLAYDVIPSRFEGRQRMIRYDDLEAYLELVPDAVYANHTNYETEKRPDDLGMRDAYAYYSDVDPNPITLNSFRSLVAAGIIRPVRTADNPKAPLLGFRRQEIAAFLALRQRILEKNAETPTTKSFLARKAAEKKQGDQKKRQSVVAQLMQDAIDRARPKIEAAERKMRAKAERKTPAPVPEPPVATEPEAPEPEAPKASKKKSKRVSVKNAYAYYRTKCVSPFGATWFREKIAQGVAFDAISVAHNTVLNPNGKKYLVRLESIDEYLAEHPEGKPLPAYLPLETAYHKLREQMPPGTSLCAVQTPHQRWGHPIHHPQRSLEGGPHCRARLLSRTRSCARAF